MHLILEYAGYKTHGVSHHMQDTQLDLRLRKHRLYRVRKAFESINTRDKNILHTTGLQFGEHVESEFRAFVFT